MGCAICTQLIDMWSLSGTRRSQTSTDMYSLPEVSQQDYHRLSGLHYTSSFSDAEDCCDDITSTSSSSSDYLGMDCWHFVLGILQVMTPCAKYFHVHFGSKICKWFPLTITLMWFQFEKGLVSHLATAHHICFALTQYVQQISHCHNSIRTCLWSTKMLLIKQMMISILLNYLKWTKPFTMNFNINFNITCMWYWYELFCYSFN